MGRFLGDQASTVLFYESGTYGNKSGPQWPGLVTENEITENVNVSSLRYAGTLNRNVDQYIDGPLDFTGRLVCHPQNFRWFVFAMGSVVDAGSPSPYTHVISELNNGSSSQFISGTKNPFTSFQIEDAQKAPGTGVNFVRTVQGAVANVTRLSAGEGELANLEIEYVAQNVLFTSGALTAATEDTTRPFQWRDFLVHIPSGTVFTEIKDVSLEINNNFEAPHYLNGSRVIDAPIALNRDYTLSLTLHGTSERTKTLYDQYFLGGSTFNAMLAVSASTGSREGFFVMSGCKLVEMSAPTRAEGVQEQSVTIRPQTMVLNVNDTVFKYGF